MKRIEHGMLLDGKSVMDDALPELAEIHELVPDCLHKKLEAIINRFEETLAGCDISKEQRKLAERVSK